MLRGGVLFVMGVLFKEGFLGIRIIIRGENFGKDLKDLNGR